MNDALNAKRRKWRANNRAHYRARDKIASLKKRYGLTPMSLEIMLLGQEGKCRLCLEPLKPGKGTHVDHDHVTGRIRGVLCLRCNVALGALGTLGDGEAGLLRALAYVRGEL